VNPNFPYRSTYQIREDEAPRSTEQMARQREMLHKREMARYDVELAGQGKEPEPGADISVSNAYADWLERTQGRSAAIRWLTERVRLNKEQAKERNTPSWEEVAREYWAEREAAREQKLGIRRTE